MIRYYAARALQLLGLILTAESLLLYFGEMGPMLETATLGAGVFFAGWLVQPKGGK